MQVVLTIAGSDSSAGAGIQADLKAIHAAGAYAATVITAITAQNSQGVAQWQAVSPEMVRAQMRAVLEDMPVKAVKTGMLPDAQVIDVVAQELARYRPAFYVCDPVWRASRGQSLVHDEGVAAAMLKQLWPLASLITPNAQEASLVLGQPVRTVHDAQAAAQALAVYGSQAVLLKGGHLDDVHTATDILWHNQQLYVFG